jgi:hypothetical protein
MVEGTVVDSAGKPVTKGLVIWSEHPYWAEGVNETQIDGAGRFKTIPLKPGEYPITVAAPGLQPVQQKVRVEVGMEPLRFELSPGKRLVMKTVDRHGRSIPDAYVGLGSWRGTEALYNENIPTFPIRAFRDTPIKRESTFGIGRLTTRSPTTSAPMATRPKR